MEINCVCSAQIFVYWKGHLRSNVLLICFLAIFLLNMFDIVVTLHSRPTRRKIGALLFTIMFIGNVVVAAIYIFKLCLNIKDTNMTCEHKIIIYIFHEFGTLTSAGSLLSLTAVNYIQMNQNTFQTLKEKQQILKRTLSLQLCMVVVNVIVAAPPALINRRIAFGIPICFQVMYLLGIVVKSFQMNKIVKLAVQNGTLENGYMEYIKELQRIIIPFVILTAILKTLLLTIRVLWATRVVDTSSPTLVWLKLSCYMSFSIMPILYIIRHKVIFIGFLSVLRSRNNEIRENNVSN